MMLAADATAVAGGQHSRAVQKAPYDKNGRSDHRMQFSESSLQARMAAVPQVLGSTLPRFVYLRALNFSQLLVQES